MDNLKTRKRLIAEREKWRRRAAAAEMARREAETKCSMLEVAVMKAEQEAALCRAHLAFTREELRRRGEEIPFPAAEQVIRPDDEFAEVEGAGEVEGEEA